MFKRHRRLRVNKNMRNLVKDVYLDTDDLVYPLFIEEGKDIKSEIPSMHIQIFCGQAERRA